MLASMVITGALPLAGAAQTPPAGGTQCASWELYWTIDDAVNGIVNNTLITSDPRATPPTPVPNPVVSGDSDYSGSNSPGFPYHGIAATDAQWKCGSTTAAPLGSARTAEEEKSPPGMELCVQAAKLAKKFGGLTALNLNFLSKIQTSVLNDVKDYLSKQFKGTTGVDLNINTISSSTFNAAGKYIGLDFNDLFDSGPMSKQVNDKIKEIESTAKDKLLNAAGLGGGGMPSIPGLGGLGGGDTVPVKDEAAIAQQKAIEKKIDQQIAEQKIAEVNADTRVKCKELLITTNETIKRALLYQLSTQIVDWVQTGKTPQFVKQPGKFLEDTGRLALDRFISRVAPRLCEPFRLSVQLQIPSTRREDNPFYEQITCTLDKVVANVDNFYRDFRQGGWIGYQEILKPQNNYYGASLAVIDEAMKQQAAAQAAALQAQTNGYTSVKQCTEWAKFISYTGPTDNYALDIRDGGNDNYFVRDSNADAEVTNGAGPLDPDGKVANNLIQEPQTGRIEKGVRFWENPHSSTVGSSYFWECEADEITQPANIAAGLAQKASQTDIDNLAASQDVSMFLQSIEDSIINKLTKSGVKGLQGLLKGLPPITP